MPTASQHNSARHSLYLTSQRTQPSAGAFFRHGVTGPDTSSEPGQEHPECARSCPFLAFCLGAGELQSPPLWPGRDWCRAQLRGKEKGLFEFPSQKAARSISVETLPNPVTLNTTKNNSAKGRKGSALQVRQYVLASPSNNYFTLLKYRFCFWTYSHLRCTLHNLKMNKQIKMNNTFCSVHNLLLLLSVPTKPR